MPKPPRCHWDTNTGWVTPEHIRDCTDTACTGCQPCDRDHCGMRGRCHQHVNHGAGVITCPRCIGNVRDNIAAIVQAYETDLHEEAERLGVTSEAFMLIGPAVAPEIVHLAKLQDNPLDIDPDHHPLRVLGDWDMTVRAEYEMPTGIRVTVARSAAYLKDMLATSFPHRPEFEQFADQVAACRTHIEAVLHDSRAREVGARCPSCETNPPKLQRRYAEHATDDLEDTWHCPADAGHWWTMTDYRLRVDADFFDTAEWLPLQDAAKRTLTKPGTIQKMSQRGHVKKRTVAGRVVYRIADIITRKDGSA